MDTLVLLEHEKDYKGCNYWTTNYLMLFSSQSQILLLPSPEHHHPPTTVHTPGTDDRVRELEILVPPATSLLQLLDLYNKAQTFDDSRTELLSDRDTDDSRDGGWL